MSLMELQERIASLPPEVIDNIKSFTDGYTMSAMGIDSTSSAIFRHNMFLTGGPGVAISEIFRQGGDPRALITLRNIIPADLAITKAAITKDPKILARVFAIWSTTQSDPGLTISMMIDFRFGVDNITSSLENRNVIISYRNGYYLNRGMTDKYDGTLGMPFLLPPLIDSGLPLNKIVYDKMYERADHLYKVKMATSLDVEKDIYELLDQNSIDSIYWVNASDDMSIARVIEIYNNYHRKEGFRYDLEECIIKLCKRVSTLECLDGILNKDTSEAYSQAARYFTGAPGYIHPMLTGDAIDTGNTSALNNIVSNCREHEQPEIINAMAIRGWTLDMIMDKFPPGVLPERRDVQTWMGRHDMLGLYKKGLVDINTIASYNVRLEAGSLKDLDRNSAEEIIRLKGNIIVDSIDSLLWVWREFGQSMDTHEDPPQVTYSTPVSITMGHWRYHKNHPRLFFQLFNECPGSTIDIYLCWTSYIL